MPVVFAYRRLFYNSSLHNLRDGISSAAKPAHPVNCFVRFAVDAFIMILLSQLS
jgi:hypothetical protein